MHDKLISQNLLVVLLQHQHQHQHHQSNQSASESIRVNQHQSQSKSINQASISTVQHQSMTISLFIEKKIYVYWHKCSKSQKVSVLIYLKQHHKWMTPFNIQKRCNGAVPRSMSGPKKSKLLREGVLRKHNLENALEVKCSLLTLYLPSSVFFVFF